MIMCHMGYREMSLKDFASWNDWLFAVGANHKYCRELPKHRIAEYRHKCPYWMLPSFHPFWRRRTHLRAIKEGRRHIENLKACKKNPALIPVFYNSSTQLRDIEERVAAIPKRRQSW
jgi:hypothetical protein